MGNDKDQIKKLKSKIKDLEYTIKVLVEIVEKRKAIKNVLYVYGDEVKKELKKHHFVI